MKALTFNSSTTASKNFIKGIFTAFLLSTASLAQAGTGVVTMTDNYLYESLIQTEFDIENQMQASVAQSSTATVQEALMVANILGTEEAEIALTESAQVAKVLAE